ncbi:NAD(P)H nitroreductase [Nocardia sp. NPDC051756]|uniref:NAD(P)H nitroreductase n=1 Tax=Nocardia sp. NPDC051756 TaxID=3154751 RepID=UPI003446AF73
MTKRTVTTMNHGQPDEHTLRAALALAVRAPSVRNGQPWRFRISARGVDLFLDPARVRPPTQSVRRAAVLSCGAALHHLRIALAAAGWSAVVRRLPDPAEPDHLASVELVPHRPTRIELSLSDAIARRRTDHRNFGSPIPQGYIGLANERAMTLGANVQQLTELPRVRVAEALRDAATEPPAGTELDLAELLVLSTPTDDESAWLSAGEALSAILLTATNVDLASCALIEPLEIPELRRRIRRGVLADRSYPQSVIRIGWAPVDSMPLPVTPRRALGDVLERTEATAC